MSDSERSAEPIRRHDEPSSRPQPLLPTRAQRGASRLTPAACLPRTPTRLELQPASPPARLERSPPRAPSAADGRRTASAAQALIRRHDEPSSHPRPLLPTRAQRGASRPPPVGCLPRTSDSLEPHRLEPSPTHQRKKTSRPPAHLRVQPSGSFFLRPQAPISPLFDSPDIHADIERLHTMRERADRDDIDSCGGSSCQRCCI